MNVIVKMQVSFTYNFFAFIRTPGMGFPGACPYYESMQYTLSFLPPPTAFRLFIFAFGFPRSIEHGTCPADGKHKQILNFGVQPWKLSLLSGEVPED
ncbi:hypothetical protein [Bowmanella denitrificans]